MDATHAQVSIKNILVTGGLDIYFAYTEGLPTIALRIGIYMHPPSPKPLSTRDLRTYLHPDDLNQRLVKCLETPGLQFAILHAASDNRFKRLDISATIRDFGYQPKADAFEIFSLRKNLR